MPIESVKQRIQNLADGRDRDELYKLLSALVDGVQALAAKLDADATVTDTNYAAVLATYIAD